MKKEKGLPYSVEAAKAKLFAAEVAMEVTTKAIQLMVDTVILVTIRLKECSVMRRSLKSMRVLLKYSAWLSVAQC